MDIPIILTCRETSAKQSLMLSGVKDLCDASEAANYIAKVRSKDGQTWVASL